jgi:hypothetical protein
VTLVTEEPTGKPSWPIIVLAGREGSGKTWSAIEASGSTLVGRTLVLTLGEDSPDEYKLIPGAKFEKVPHAGTVSAIIAKLDEMEAEPDRDGKPTLWIIDSGSRYWGLLSDNAQLTANKRQKRPDGTVTVDLWNQAAKDWESVFKRLRAHNGPVIMTARLEQVAIMNGNTPTAEKDWKIYGHKSLPYDAQVIVEMPERGEYLLRKVKSARWTLKEKTAKPDFTVDWLWHALGFGDTEVQSQDFTAPVAEAHDADESGRDWLTELSDTNGDVDLISALGLAARSAGAAPDVLAALRQAYVDAKATRDGQPKPETSEA